MSYLKYLPFDIQKEIGRLEHQQKMKRVLYDLVIRVQVKANYKTWLETKREPSRKWARWGSKIPCITPLFGCTGCWKSTESIHYDNKDTIQFNCGHRVCMKNCGMKKRCPICRERVTGTFQCVPWPIFWDWKGDIPLRQYIHEKRKK
jgi:hypothetical protein